MDTALDHLRKMKSIKVQVWRKLNPRRQLANALRYRYGLTLADYDEMLTEQKGGCAICGGGADNLNKRNKHFTVDHNHKTGQIRGLLCSGCNVGIAEFNESAELLNAAADYLEA